MSLHSNLLQTSYFQKVLHFIPGEVRSRILLIADEEWVPLLQPLSGPAGFDILTTGDIALKLAGTDGQYDTMVICTPFDEEGWLQEVTAITGHFKDKPLVLRFLRNLLLRKSYLLEKAMKSREEWKRYPGETEPYFIFAIPRSGSSFLADILKNTGIFGKPQEHLLKEVEAFLLSTDLKLDEWLEGLTRYSYTPNGSSGTKLISHLFLATLEDIQDDPVRMENLARIFSGRKVIYIKRMNRIRQAISLLKATRSGIWHIKDRKYVKSESSLSEIQVTNEMILDSIAYTMEQETRLEKFFADFRIHPLLIFYEDVGNELTQQKTLREIFKFLGQVPMNGNGSSVYKPMADEESDELFENFLAWYIQMVHQSDKLTLPMSDCLLESLAAELKYGSVARIKKSGPLKRFLKFLGLGK